MKGTHMPNFGAPRCTLSRRVHWAIAVLFLMPGTSVRAQDNEGLAKAAQNPIADMISLPFQNNTTLNAGPKSQTQNVLNVQPVFPIGLNPDWNVITRKRSTDSEPDAVPAFRQLQLSRISRTLPDFFAHHHG
jgi:glycosidase